MLKNDTLKNGTSRTGLYGSAPRGLYSPSKMINELGVNRLKLMGFRKITDEDVRPSRS